MRVCMSVYVCMWQIIIFFLVVLGVDFCQLVVGDLKKKKKRKKITEEEEAKEKQYCQT